MTKKKKANRRRAAGFSQQTMSECNSITALRTILKYSPIVHNLFPDGNTFPNIDGYLLPTEGEDRVQVGTLEVQVKALDEGDWSRRGFNTDFAFLDYCKNRASSPVLLIGTHSTKNQAYWIHIDQQLCEKHMKEILDREKGTTTIRFPKENRITSRTKDYSAWEALARNAVATVKLQSRLGMDLKSIEEMIALNHSVSEPRMLDFDVEKCQRFIDEYNKLIAVDFPVLKKVFFPGVWKMGIGVSSFSETDLAYALYPIRTGSTDLLIKKLKERPKNIDLIRHMSFNSVDNPIYRNPERYAQKLVFPKMQELIEKDILSFENNGLAKEMIFSATRDPDFREIIGIDYKDEYSVSELKDGFDRFLPLLVNLLYFYVMPKEFNQVVEVSIKNRGAVQIEDMLQISQFALGIDYQKIRDEVLHQIEGGVKCSTPFPIYSENFNLNVIRESLNGLTGQKIKSLYCDSEALNPEAEFSLASYKTEEFYKNAKFMYENIPSAFDSIVKSSFSSLEGKIDFFDEAYDRIVVIIPEPEDGKIFYRMSLHTLYLKSIEKSAADKSVDVILQSEMPELPEDLSIDQRVVYNGTEYELLGEGSSIVPMTFSIYERAKNAVIDRISKYFGIEGSPMKYWL